MKKHLLAAFLCALTPLAHAEIDVSLDEVVVTATRIEQPLKRSLSSTSVITRQEIHESQAADVPSVLKYLAGVEFYQSGGIGKQSSLFMRGTNSNQVLVLLDGVRTNSATSGATAIDQIMLDQVERIEVVRGNASSLYGSEAIGGVIQIFTRRGKGELAFNGSAGVGTHNTKRASAGFGGNSVGTDFNIQVSKYMTDGVSAINPSLASNVNPDNDSYHNASVSATVRHAFTDKNSLLATVYETRGDNQYDNSGFFTAASDTHNNKSTISKFSLVSDNSLTENWQSKAQVAQGIDEYKGFTNDSQTSSIKTNNDQVSWQNTLTLSADEKLLIGVEGLDQRVNSVTAYTKTTRNVGSSLLGYTGKFDSHQIQVNLRHDNFSDFGVANTGLLAYGYALSEPLRITASVSSAFKAPTFNDLYGPAGWGSNPDLRPERSNNNEIGLRYAKLDRNIDFVYFDNRTNDLIVSDATWTMQNLNHARVNGIELNYEEEIYDSRVRATLTRQNPRDTDTNKLLLRRAELYANFSLTRQIGAWKMGGELQYSGEREDSDINTFSRTTLASYSVVNLTARYKFDKHWDMALRADNLLDQNYMLAHGYNTLGRTLFAGLSYQ